ncbi:MAG TPA: hypothetical protein VH619_19735 [Verrucomicrobiae bacterium]|jgi:hypothetical protein|nr:hypothetical protein [Verrucomicrobiae bacterium]
MKLQTIVFVIGLLALDLFFSNPTQAAAVVNQLPPGTSISLVGGGDSYGGIATPDGRYVLFASSANNLAASTNGGPGLAYTPAPANVFERDRVMQSNILISINGAGTGGGNGDSWPSAISADGRYVLFDSVASDLIANDTNGAKDIFLRDTVSGMTSLVSVSTNGGVGNGESREAVMTPDGRYVAFASVASNLVPNDTNGIPDVFVRDMQAGTTVMASQGANTLKSYIVAPTSEWPIISSDGRYVAFYSTATNLVANTGTSNDVYVRDLVGNVTLLASKAAHGLVTSPVSDVYAMSTNGEFIAYQTTGTSPAGVAFRYNVTTGATDIIATNGAVPGTLDHEERNIDISANGQFVAFVQETTTNSKVELWNNETGTNALISSGQTGTVDSTPRLDQSGRYVAFLGNDDLTTNSNGTNHIFVRDTFAGNVQMADVWTNNLSFSSMEVAFYFSANGNLVAFTCWDGTIDLSPNQWDVFGRDLGANTTEVISAPAAGLASVTSYGGGSISGVEQFEWAVRGVCFSVWGIGRLNFVWNQSYLRT